ncbi:exodeoxyribonuclease III [Chitinophaga horti]|uniref:Exodeoxyribonuclease III n=1 Tax=Chitinophaga horti TaxID=2920382 RepID=A0ABY6J7D6_9BACT|nr:exodeoxyribonuclease III [Chitinophaga horti]UYQ95600.1 exodeoxyribonuclease III [Chitinophaga horti]
MLKIATYNINGVNGRLPLLLRWLKEAKPDIVCLQELKSPGSRFPAAALEAAGYSAIWHGQKSWNGVAILSRGLPIQEVRRQLPGDPKDTQSRYIEAIVGQMVVACLYLPNGNPYPGDKFDYKLKWFRRLAAHAKKLQAYEVPVMLVGDFNVMPTELDVYKPEKYEDNALFRKESRAAYARLLKAGWTDALRYLYPDKRIYTFWDYLRRAYERNAGLRLDHFLLNGHLLGRLKRGGVDVHVRGWEGASDHAPAWVVLK